MPHCLLPPLVGHPRCSPIPEEMTDAAAATPLLYSLHSLGRARAAFAIPASSTYSVAIWQNLIPSFPRPPPWRNPRKGRDQILPSGNHDGRGRNSKSSPCPSEASIITASPPPRLSFPRGSGSSEGDQHRQRGRGGRKAVRHWYSRRSLTPY